MRSAMRRVLLAITITCLGILTACGGSSKSTSTPPAPAQLVLTPPAAAYTAIVGDAPYTVSVLATKAGTPVTTDSFTVTSSDPSVVNITMNGSTAILSPVGVGTANIVFTSGSGLTQTVKATIHGDESSLSLSPDLATTGYAAIANDPATHVTVTSVQKDGSSPDTKFTVKSSNTGVVSTAVSGTDVALTPKGQGTATITFTSGSNTSVTKVVNATVAADLTAISLSDSSYTTTIGAADHAVTVTAVNNKGAADTFTVASSDITVATVSPASGNSGDTVKIKPSTTQSGTATITFASGSEPTRVTSAITVTVSQPVASLTLSPADTSYSVAALSAPINLTVTATKADGVTADTFTTSSTNATIASVSPASGNSGNTVTIAPLKEGDVTIDIHTGAGLSAQIAVHVTASLGSIAFSPSATSHNAELGGVPYMVKVTALKADGVTPDTFTVTSSSTATATVSPASGNNGDTVTITPVAAGQADIVFTLGSAGSVTNTISVTVGLSGCDGTEWFCDDFQKETLSSSTVSNWDLTPFGSNASYSVVGDPNAASNYALQYTAGSSSVDIVAPGQVIALIKDSVWATIPNQSDYYLEARLMPQSNSKQGNKQLYMITHYEDASNWYFEGLNMQSSPRMEAGYDKAGTITAASRTVAADLGLTIKTGTQGQTDGQWHTLRMEMIGGVQNFFYDGLQLPSFNDSDIAGGKVGLFTYNKSFMIDDVRVGAVQLSLTPNARTYTAAAQSGAYVVTVRAVKPDGTTPDTFTVTSSDPSIATAVPEAGDGTKVDITPLAQGTATITFASGSTPGLSRTIALTITAPVITNNASITLSPSATSWNGVVGGATYPVTVTAIQSDGITADTFTAATSDVTVASITPDSGTLASGSIVTVTPLKKGTATITFTGGAGQTASLAVTVADQAAISLTPATASYDATPNGTPISVVVTALKHDGTADTFTVASDNSAAASVSTASGTSGNSGDTVTITPGATQGVANIAITSGTGLTAQIVVNVAQNLTALTLSPSSTTYHGEVGGTPDYVSVTAVKADGSADTFTAVSDAPTVASIISAGTSVTITPVAPGTANITITSGSGLSATITATIDYSGCDGTEWFCDDFQSQTETQSKIPDNWNLLPGVTSGDTSHGSFAVVPDINISGNYVLQYTAGSTVGNVIALLKDAAWANVTPHLNATGDYYVEARIKPQTNSTTSNKQLYLMARCQNCADGTVAANWTGFVYGGLNVQSSDASTAVEAGTAKDASGTITLTRLFQTKKPITMGTQGGNPTGTPGTDGTWYTVRYEVVGNQSTVYLNGAPINSKADTNDTFTSGKIGLFTANKSFLIDDVRVGDPANKPVAVPQLSIAPNIKTYSDEAGNAATTISVVAIKSDQTTDTFTASSDNTAVVTAVANTTAKTVTITPLSQGTATITIASGSNPSLTVTVAATVAPPFVQSTTNYGDLSGNGGLASPTPGTSAAYIDDRLVLTFDSIPVLSGAGSVRIFKSADDSLVDIIPLSGATDSIGYGYSTSVRGVNTTPVWVSGNSLVVAPHSSKMAWGTGYYVAIANGAITGAGGGAITLNGTTFNGLGKAAGWSFTTGSAPATAKTTLAVNGTAGSTPDFRTVQGALNYAMQNAVTYTATPLTINVAAGTYRELLFLHGVNNVTINGAGQAQTVIQYENYETLNSGTGSSGTGATTTGGGRAVFLVENSDLLTLQNLTLKNTHLRTNANGTSNQAETIYFKDTVGTNRLIAQNAEFDSEQDTLQLQGYSWFYNTLITGNVDFIWGQNYTALFENSEIRTVGDSSSTAPSGGYLVQARTNVGGKGFIFLNSKLTQGTGPGGQTVATGSSAATYLARSGGVAPLQDNVIYVNCQMDTHIIPLGWAANIAGNPLPTPSPATFTAGWREAGSLQLSDGTTPVDVSQRSTSSLQMTTDNITNYGYDTRQHIFADWNNNTGWSPQPLQ